MLVIGRSHFLDLHNKYLSSPLILQKNDSFVMLQLYSVSTQEY